MCDQLISCLEVTPWSRLKIQAYELGYQAHRRIGSEKRFAQYAFEFLKLCSEFSIDCKTALEEIDSEMSHFKEGKYPHCC